MPHEAQARRSNEAVPAGAARVEIAGVTDVGRHRRRNEDAIDWDAKLGVAMVADGMGGGQAGHVASVTALRSIRADLRRALADGARRGPRAQLREVRGSLVVELVRRANQDVRKNAARDNRLNGMGTTLVLALAGPDYVTIAHVGDSRIYRLRDGTLSRLTDDHTVVQELVERGEMKAHEAAVSRHRNVITRALGIAQDVVVDVAHHPTAVGDLYLLCSDGLTNMVSEADIAVALCSATFGLEQVARNIVALANERGGRDNVSVVLMRIAELAHG